MDLRGFTPSPQRALILILADEQSWESPAADFTGVPTRLFMRSAPSLGWEAHSLSHPLFSTLQDQ